VLLHRGGTAFSVHLVRMRGARRYILRVRPDGALRVTVPRGGSHAEALRFAERHLAWAERERARLLSVPGTPRVWGNGTVILLDGEPTTIVLGGDGRRLVARAGHIAVPIADEVDVRPALEQRMRAVAREQLTEQLHALAAQLDLPVAGISIRNQRSRWGSCSPSGRIALNFRLIQMPPRVREYILIHELMHLRQANHSRRFWALVESVHPDFRESERWLKTVGRMLF
jgi:predicted metal-dependent hydrolase